MKTSISSQELTAYVAAQINHLFPDPYAVAPGTIAAGVSEALDRIEHCFKFAKSARYATDGDARFNHLHSDQYLVFLWMLSNSLHKMRCNENALDKVYSLNKTLHSFDCIYSNPLPDVFLVIHGVGTVLGKATYSDFLVVHQGCTVGQNHGVYPVLGRGVGLGTGASVLGAARIGDGASVGAGVTILDRAIEKGHVAFRSDSGALLIQPAKSPSIASDYFIF